MKIERLVGRGEQLLPGLNHAPAWEISKWNGMITILFGTFMLFHDCITGDEFYDSCGIIISYAHNYTYTSASLSLTPGYWGAPVCICV